MVANLTTRTKAFFEKAFPERQIYHRSGGSVRYVSISPWRQAMMAGAATIVVGWCLFATVAVLLRGPAMDAQYGVSDRKTARLERELRQAQAREETALGLLQKRTSDFESDMEDAANEMLRRYGCPTLVTGGGLQGNSLDVLAGLDGLRHFSFPTVQRAKIHGTGATFSAAIAAGLSKGDSLREAILAAKLYVSAAISAAPRLDNGRSALWHSVTVREQVIATQSDEWPAVHVHQPSSG